MYKNKFIFSHDDHFGLEGSVQGKGYPPSSYGVRSNTNFNTFNSNTSNGGRGSKRGRGLTLLLCVWLFKHKSEARPPAIPQCVRRRLRTDGAGLVHMGRRRRGSGFRGFEGPTRHCACVPALYHSGARGPPPHAVMRAGPAKAWATTTNGTRQTPLATALCQGAGAKCVLRC